MVSTEQIIAWLADANQRTHGVYGDLDEGQQVGPQMAIVNPPRWEVGHVGWFTEKWVLRHVLGRDPIMANGDSFYDSIAIAHDRRWVLDLPTWEEAWRYLDAVSATVGDALSCDPEDEKLRYFARYAVCHHDMHNEALAYTRQTLGYAPPPCLATASCQPEIDDAPHGDRRFPAGSLMLGASRDQDFVFDNEKWEHEVAYEGFAMACSAVTQKQFLEFVEDGGYQKESCWDGEGSSWLAQIGATHPVYWRRNAHGGWERRWFDRWLPLEPELPVIHVNWHEANAFCHWAGRRLPTEVEWEVAAGKSTYPWGEDPPGPTRANLDWQHGGCVPVAAYPSGESAAGCRQLMGNVWEWTSSTFRPYPGFVPDPYEEYSEPWFETRKVLRGGAWCTMSRMMRNSLRNFYEPDRRDVWAGFRTCSTAP
jgi:ergothioneine biosynthesis protein EgtB